MIYQWAIESSSLADYIDALICQCVRNYLIDYNAHLLFAMQTSVAPPGPSKLVQSTTADEVDQQEDNDGEEGEGNDSEDEEEEDEDDEEAEQDGDASMTANTTPGKKMTARQQEKAAEKKLKAAQRSAKKVGQSMRIAAREGSVNGC